MLRVHDIMSVEVRTIVPEATLAEATAVLTEEHYTGLPVTASGGEVLGVISASDILDFTSSNGESRGARGRSAGTEPWSEPMEWEEGEEAPGAYFASFWDEDGANLVSRMEQRTEDIERDLLDEHSVGELMTRTVVSISPDANVSEAARKMLRAGIHRLLVMEEDRLVGLVTTTDIVKAVAQYGVAG